MAAPDTFLFAGVRTPRGRGNAKGSLFGTSPVDLLGTVGAALRARCPGLDDAVRGGVVRDALIGCVTQAGDQGGGLARLGLLAGGFDEALPSATLNRLCASSLSATLQAARGVAGHTDGGLALAGGVESLSRVPLGTEQGPLTHQPAAQARAQVAPIGVCADAVAHRLGLSRADLDAYAVRSQQRAGVAVAEGRFDVFGSVAPVVGADGAVRLAKDETPRPQSTLESLQALPAVFLAQQEALDDVTRAALGAPFAALHGPGNAPALADAAALVVVGTEDAGAAHGLVARARLAGGVEVGASRSFGLTGIKDATTAVLRQCGLKAGDIDLFEVNESFAALMIDFQRAFDVDDERLNVNGGAIALGHPMGATGAILLLTLVDELARRGLRRGLCAVGGATGLATAVVVEIV